jgi:hypothetical protein
VRVRALCWVEIEILDPKPGADPNREFQQELDFFREEVRPANNYGIAIYRQDPMAWEEMPPRRRITRKDKS